MKRNKKTLCAKCHKYIKVENFDKHYNSCRGTVKKVIQYPISGDGSICDVINQFINHMNIATGGNTIVDWDFENDELIIYYESHDHPPIKNERPEIDMNALYEGEYVKKLYRRDQREPEKL